MRSDLRTLGRAIGQHKFIWLSTVVGFISVYYLMLFAAMVVRFDNVPNYVTFYDYIGNVVTILKETPAFSDAINILKDEWLIEIGFMNYDYGNGVSEWALNVIPSYLVVQIAAGMLVATAVVVVVKSRGACTVRSNLAAMSVTGGGAFLVGFTTATLSWVVCCAAPTWVVGLAMLGMSASLALWFEPVGLALSLMGFALLLAGVLLLSRERTDVKSQIA